MSIKYRTTARAWRWRGNLYSFPERQPIKELKYRISTKAHQRIFSSELLMNSEQKADKMHVSPAIAKPTVIGIFLFVHCLKLQKFFLSLKQ
jgi:hypothetical protein